MVINILKTYAKGRYREPDFVTSRKAKKTIVDLDKAATKLGIDVVAISTEMNEGHSKVWEAIRMMQDKGDSPEARKIAEEVKNSIRVISI